MEIEIIVSTEAPWQKHFAKQRITVGRATTNDLVLNDTTISRCHLQIENNAQVMTVTDLGSDNGTYLGETRLPTNVGCVWGPGQELRVGHHRLRLVCTETVPAVRSIELPTVPTLGRTLRLRFGAWPRWGQGLLRHLTLRQRSGLPRLALPATWRRWLGLISRRQRLSPWTIPVLLALYIGGSLIYQGIPLPFLSRQGRTSAPTRALMPTLLLARTAFPTFTATPDQPSGVGGLNSTDVTPVPVTDHPDNGLAAKPTTTLVPTLTPTPTSVSTPTQMPATPLPAGAELVLSASASRRWDGRLGQLGIRLEEAEVATGGQYWRLVEAVWQDEKEAGGKHHIYVEVVDEQGQPVADVVGVKKSSP